MQKIKKSLLVGAGVVTLGVGGLGISSIASADTTANTTGDSSLVDKIASTFGLDKSKVQAVFDQNRATHQAEMKQDRADALKQAVTDGKLTQSQADHITATWAEIDAIRSSVSSPKDLTDAQRTDIKNKREALHSWEKSQNLDLRSILGMPKRGFGMGHHGMMGDTDDAPASTSSSTSSATSAS